LIAQRTVLKTKKAAARAKIKAEYKPGFLVAKSHSGAVTTNAAAAHAKIKPARSNSERNLDFILAFIYSSEIASEGQTPAQEPQLMHVPASMTRFESFSEIAETGHSDSQAPQFTQASEIL
jgi:hypothetical protein